MLIKHVMGYLPSLVVPGLTSFAAVYCYTRLLTPHEYGLYALALSLMTLLNAVFFYWLQVSLPRLMPQAVKAGKAEAWHTTIYGTFVIVCLILIAGGGVFNLFVPTGDFHCFFWLVILLAFVRSCLTLNQAFHRINLAIGRYNLIECGQAVLGLAGGLTLISIYGMGSHGALWGVILGMACMIIVDIRQWMNLSVQYFSRDILKEIVHFGLPLTFTYGLACVISSSDRFLIEYFRGAGEVGIYAAGFTLMDRITAITFMMVSLPSFPLTIRRMEHEGVTQAQQQTYDNGVVALALSLPLLAGLILAKDALANVVIGSQFRIGALQVMPWIACSAFMNGFATHYFDHAFYLAKKPSRLFLTQGPAAIVNITLNLLLIPRYGYMGAAFASAVSCFTLLLLSICAGRSVFAIRFPLREGFKITCAVIAMALLIKWVAFPATLTGLLLMALTGIMVYAACLITFNVSGVRSKLLNRFI